MKFNNVLINKKTILILFSFLAFSLFNVVTFKNEECIANSANDLRGTCYTTEGNNYATSPVQGAF